MSEAAKKAPAIPRPAATVVILRDGSDGIEVFMVVRHHEIDFASGALVFPGGKVDDADADLAWEQLAPSSASPAERPFLVASARETFEEAGLMLARRGGSPDLLGAEAAQRLVETYRARLIAGNASFLDLVRTENLRLAADLMVPFAHWITPESQPKRFDTRFLLVSAPVGQLGAHDGAESVEGFWISPKQALQDAKAGTRTLLRLDKVLSAAVSAGNPSPQETLVRIAIAYCDFAAENLELWRAMFEHRMEPGKEVPDWSVDDQLQLFRHIYAPLAALFPDRGTEELGITARSLFSAVHGMVALGLEQRLVAVPLPALRKEIAGLVRAMIDGLIARAA